MATSYGLLPNQLTINYPLLFSNHINNVSFFNDGKNNKIILLMYNSYKGTYSFNITANAFNMGLDGEILKIDQLEFQNHFGEIPHRINYYVDFKPIPRSLTTLWDSKNPVEKGYFEFVESFAGKGDVTNFFWTILHKQGYDIIMTVKDSNSEIKAYKIEN